jgi:hypothetical protein
VAEFIGVAHIMAAYIVAAFIAVALIMAEFIVAEGSAGEVGFVAERVPKSRRDSARRRL